MAALMTSPFQAVHSVVPQVTNSADYVKIWPWYLGFCMLASVLAMGYVFARFESRSLKASNTK